MSTAAIDFLDLLRFMTERLEEQGRTEEVFARNDAEFLVLTERAYDLAELGNEDWKARVDAVLRGSAEDWREKRYGDFMLRFQTLAFMLGGLP